MASNNRQRKKYQKKYQPYQLHNNNDRSNQPKTYIHKINVSDQVKSSSTGEISEMIPFPNAPSNLLNEYKDRYQEYRLVNLKIKYKNMFNKPPPNSGGTRKETIVSYMGRCHKDGLSNDYDSLYSTEGSFEYSIYDTFTRYWYPRDDVVNEGGRFRQTAIELDNFGTFKMIGFTNLVGSLIGEIQCEYTYEFRGAKIDIINNNNMNE